MAFVAGAGTGAAAARRYQRRGQPAIAWYILDPTGGSYEAASIEVLDLSGDKVKHITTFADAGLFPAFGLPGALPA